MWNNNIPIVIIPVCLLCLSVGKATVNPATRSPLTPLYSIEWRRTPLLCDNTRGVHFLTESPIVDENDLRHRFHSKYDDYWFNRI